MAPQRAFNAQQEVLQMYNAVDPSGMAAATYESTMRWAKEHIAPIANEADANHQFPLHLWEKMGEQELLGITIAEEYGGSGLGYLCHFAAMEAIAYYSGGIALSYSVQSNLFLDSIQHYGNDIIKQKYLNADYIKGRKLGAVAHTETDNHSDTKEMKFKFEDVPGTEQLNGNGSKIYITNALMASAILIYGRSTDYNPEKPSYGVSAVMLDKEPGNPAGINGVTLSTPLNKAGMKASETIQFWCADTKIPKENIVLLNTANGMQMDSLGKERSVLSGGPMGAMQAAFETSFQMLNDANLLDKPEISYKLTNVYMEMTAARRNAMAVMAKLDESMKLTDKKQRLQAFPNRDSSLLKTFTTNAALSVTNQCIDFGGGMGYMEEPGLMRHWRDAKLYNTGAGTEIICNKFAGNDLRKKL